MLGAGYFVHGVANSWIQRDNGSPPSDWVAAFFIQKSNHVNKRSGLCQRFQRAMLGTSTKMKSADVSQILSEATVNSCQPLAPVTMRMCKDRVALGIILLGHNFFHARRSWVPCGCAGSSRTRKLLPRGFECRLWRWGIFSSVISSSESLPPAEEEDSNSSSRTCGAGMSRFCVAFARLALASGEVLLDGESAASDRNKLLGLCARFFP